MCISFFLKCSLLLQKEIESELPEEESLYQEIKKRTNIAAKYLELEQCLAEVCQIVSSTLQGI